MRPTLLFATILAALNGSVLAEPPATSRDEPVRRAIERSLPYLEKAGVAWMEGKKCVSCHRVSFLTWTFNEAEQQGFGIDRGQLQARLDWSVAKSLESRGEDKPVDGALNLDGVAQLILGHLPGTPVPLPPEARSSFTRLLLDGQQPDGFWKPGGQLPDQKRSKDETTQVSTLWNVLALGVLEQTEEVSSARRRALAWLAPDLPAQSSEWFAVRLLVLLPEGDVTAIGSAVNELQSRQHPDGGWGWISADPSDAFATGLALYALARAGDASANSSIQESRQFLLDTQREDGSWAVHGTKEKKKNRVEETATYWGTAWATLGLLESLR